MIRVLLAVDDGLAIDRLQELLAAQRDIQTVRAARPAEAVAGVVREGACDLVLTVDHGGLGQPSVDGEQLLHWLRARQRGVGVITAESLARIMDAAVHPLLQPTLTREQERRLGDLTHREREVLAHITAGEPTRRVAEQLFISEKTVRNHISNAMSKLNVENRIQAALLALRAGLSAPAASGER